MSFVNLRAYTTASMQFGIFNIEEAVEQCKNNPQEYTNAFAITERNNMYSVIDFYKKATSNPEFNPIVGVDLVFAKENETILKVKEDNQEREVVRKNSETYPLLLLAKNNDGYKNLSKLQTLFYTSAKKDRVTEKIAKENQELFNDVFVLSGGNNGYLFDLFLKNRNKINNEFIAKVNNHIRFWKELSNNNFFIELQRDGTDFENDYIKFIVPLAIENQVPVVATNNVYFNKREDYETHELFMAHKDKNGYSVFATQKPSEIKATPENYFKSNSEMSELFSDIPVAVSNTQFISNQCQVKFELNQHNYLPQLKSPNPDEDMDTYFTRLSNEGLEKVMLKLLKKYGDKTEFEHGGYPSNRYFQKFEEWHKLDLELDFLSDKEKLDIIKKTQLYKEYQERLDYEVEIIKKMQFPSYFLVVHDFIKWSKENDIPVGPGRGSGAGSLVAYSLSITDLDPLQFDLLFERFLNPERVSMPDFDIDFSSAGRDKTIEYVKNKYNQNGEIHVSSIMNVGRYDVKSSIDMAAKSLKINQLHPMIKSIKELIGVQDINDDVTDGVEIEEYDDFDFDGGFFEQLKDSKEFTFQYQNNELFRKIVYTASKYYKNMRNVSKHAAGIVISSLPIDDIVPIVNIESSYLTQLNKDNSEAMGLIKFDFLGLENLHVMQHTLNEINKNKKPEDRLSLDDLSHINLYDPHVYKNIYQTGNTHNVFQFASTGMINMLQKYKPETFEDLVALVSLYRPGPMDIIPDYIDTKHGIKDVEDMAPSTPAVSEILKPTYGFIVYQEQIMQILQVYAGYSYGEADLVRRAMGKKKPEEMAKHRSIFINRAIENCSEDEVEYKTQEATAMFDKIEKFASYGFNKSHAAAYALVSYQTAWLKHYYPREYMLAVLHSNQRTKKKSHEIEKSIKDAIRNKVKIHDIDINMSQENFSLNHKGEIVVPIGRIKGMNTDIAKNISRIREEIREALNISPEKPVFTDMHHFIQTMIQNHCPISDSVMSGMIKVGAFSGIESGKEKYWQANAGALIKYIKGTQVVVQNELLKSLPSSLIKASAKQKAGKLELVDVKDNYTIKDMVANEAQLIGFVLNENKLKKLFDLQKDLFDYLKDDQFSMLNAISQVSDMKMVLTQAALERQANNEKLFGIGTKQLVMGYLIETFDGKYNKVFKIMTDSGVYELSSRDKELNDIKINPFEPYVFLLNGYLGQDSDETDLIYNFNLIDAFSLTNIFKQTIDNAYLSHENGEDFIVQTLNEYNLIINENDKIIAEPIQIKLPESEETIMVVLDEKLYEVLKENNIQFNITFKDNILLKNKIDDNELNGNAKNYIRFEEMDVKLKGNKNFNHLLNYMNLTNFKQLSSAAQPKNYTHLMYGYIKESKSYQGELSQVVFIDNAGDEIKIKPSDVLKQPEIKRNEPCLIKVNYNRTPYGEYFKLEDVYYEKALKNIHQNIFVTEYDAKEKLHGYLVEQGMPFKTNFSNNDNLEKFLNNDEYVIIKYQDLSGSRNIKSKFDIIKTENKDELSQFMMDNGLVFEKLFNFDQEHITVGNIPANYQDKNTYKAGDYFQHTVNNHIMNYRYIELESEKLTDSFMKLADVNEKSVELAKDNEFVMVSGIVSSYTEVEGKKDVFLRITDDTDTIQIKITKDKEAQYFDFKSAMNNNQPVVVKLKINAAKNDSGITYKNLIDVYTLEQAVQLMADKVFLNIEADSQNELIDYHEQISKIAKDNLDKSLTAKGKRVEIKIINKNKSLDGRNLSPIMTSYSDKLIDEIKEQFKLPNKDVYVNLKPVLNASQKINSIIFPKNIQDKMFGNQTVKYKR